MKQGEQFNKAPGSLGINKAPIPESYTDYTPEERERLKASILTKRGTEKSLTEEEDAFRLADLEYWRAEDNPE